MNCNEDKLMFETLKINGPFKRLGKTFKTKENYYFFDTGTGKVLKCDYYVYLVLKKLEETNCFEPNEFNISERQLAEAVSDIREAIDKENILQAKPVEHLTGNQTENLEQNFNDLRQVCLELTQRCNLRCKYCIYQEENHKFRNFNSSDMDFDTAKKGIEYLLKHGNGESPYIAFYGGEPLLQFDLIKKCVEYVHNRNINISFTMTTNGVLMTPEIANYLASVPNFDIVFSLDGDKITHDRYRKTINGNGSFDAAFAGFKNALAAYGNRASTHLSINTVVAPPYDDSTFDRMQEFFDNEAPDILNQYSYVDFPDDADYEARIDIMRNRKEDEWQPALTWQKKSGCEFEKLFTWESTIKSFLIIHKRLIANEPTNYKFNGCCVPGGRKVYVTTSGRLKACERMGEAPDIGDVDNGLDIEKIKRIYVDDYQKKSLGDCSQCWAVNLCGVCYAMCFGKDGVNIAKKRVSCEEQRFAFQHDLEYYHQILEEDPESLDFLNNREIL